MSLSFCLEDGSLLSAPSEPIETLGPDSATVVRSSGSNSLSMINDQKGSFKCQKDVIAAKFVHEGNTKEVHPILDSVPLYKRPLKAWKSSEFARQIAYEITGLHTYHAQHNLAILGAFLNDYEIISGGQLVERTEMSLGVGYFHMRGGRTFLFSFKSEDSPTSARFIERFRDFIGL